MSNLTDEKLIKRATHAGTNLTLLAILATIGAIVLAAYLALGAENAFPMIVPAVTIVLIAIGYWVLSVAAKRGNPSSVMPVIVIMVLQCVLVFGSHGRTTVETGGNAEAYRVGSSIPSLIIPVLIVISLAGSRKVLLELRRRDLWEPIFGSAKASGRLCVVGTILLVIGYIGLSVGLFFAGWSSGRSQHQEMLQTQSFVDMIQSEEKTFMNALEGLSDPYSAEEIQAALAAVIKLEQRAEIVKANAKEDIPLRSILEDYCDAVRRWKSGVTLLAQANPDVRRARGLLLLGDKIRTQAINAFDRQYAPNKQEQSTSAAMR